MKFVGHGIGLELVEKQALPGKISFVRPWHKIA